MAKITSALKLIVRVSRAKWREGSVKLGNFGLAILACLGEVGNQDPNAHPRGSFSGPPMIF